MPPIDPVTGTKECARCHKIYETPGTFFTKSRKSSDGLEWVCKACKKKYWHEKRKRDPEWKRKRDDQSNSKLMGRYHTDPEYRQKRNDASVKWMKEKYQNDPMYRKYVHSYNVSRKRDAVKDGTVTDESLWDLLSTWTGICPFCGKDAKPTFDHIKPLTKGGIHSLHNLQLMCLSCNSSKNNRTMEEWQEEE